MVSNITNDEVCKNSYGAEKDLVGQFYKCFENFKCLTSAQRKNDLSCIIEPVVSMTNYITFHELNYCLTNEYLSEIKTE